MKFESATDRVSNSKVNTIYDEWQINARKSTWEKSSSRYSNMQFSANISEYPNKIRNSQRNTLNHNKNIPTVFKSSLHLKLADNNQDNNTIKSQSQNHLSAEQAKNNQIRSSIASALKTKRVRDLVGNEGLERESHLVTRHQCNRSNRSRERDFSSQLGQHILPGPTIYQKRPLKDRVDCMLNPKKRYPSCKERIFQESHIFDFISPQAVQQTQVDQPTVAMNVKKLPVNYSSMNNRNIRSFRDSCKKVNQVQRSFMFRTPADYLFTEFDK